MSTTVGKLKLLRRNLIGAAVACAAAAVITATQFYPPWAIYRDTIVPLHTVPANGKIDAFGQTWQVGSVRHLDAVSSGPKVNELSSSTALFVVTIDRTGSPTLGSCVGVVSDGTRRWRDQFGRDFSVPAPAGVARQCGDAGALQLTFLLPGDAVPTAVDITSVGDRILLRFLL